MGCCVQKYASSVVSPHISLLLIFFWVFLPFWKHASPPPLLGIELFAAEDHGWCCRRGKSLEIINECRPELLEPLDSELEDLYLRNTRFRSKARQYNKLFCYSSMGTSSPGAGFLCNTRCAPDAHITLHGRTYCTMRAVDGENNPMRYYVSDPQDRYTSLGAKTLSASVIASLESFVTTHSAIAREIARIDPAMYEKHDLAFRFEPNSKDVAAVVFDQERNIKSRFVVFHTKSSTKPNRVSSLNALYEPLQYTILFPTGAAGWGLDLNERPKANRLTQFEYYRFMLSRRLHVKPTNRVTPRKRKKPLGDIESMDLLDYLEGAAVVEEAEAKPAGWLEESGHAPTRHQFWASLGRLLNEYLVDAYSRIVDQRTMFWGGDQCQGRIASYREWDEANQVPQLPYRHRIAQHATSAPLCTSGRH